MFIVSFHFFFLFSSSKEYANKLETHLERYTAEKDIDCYCRSLEATLKTKRKTSATDQNLMDAPIKEDFPDE